MGSALRPGGGYTALILLDRGAAYASRRWTLPSTATGWAQDLGGNVTSVTKSGGQAAITDSDGVGYTVGINQPFIISGNPGTVLLISPGGTVMSMSLAQAAAVRQPLTPPHVYVGTVASVDPALVLAQPGDPATITVLNTGAQESTETMQSFTDGRVPLHAPGS